MTSNSPCRVLVCQNRTCRKSGSPKILEAFKAHKADLDPTVEVIGVGCLGQCGNGPIVLILPEEIWYWQVFPNQVPIIIEKHLRFLCPISTMQKQQF